MKRFSFSLQKLLSLREFYEKEAELALGKANAVRDKIQSELEGVAKQRVEAVYERKGNLPFQDLVTIEHFITRLDVKKEKLLEDLVAAELVVEKAREKFIEASRDRKVITKLKEKKDEAWHKEVLDEEASILDDISNFRNRKE